MPPSVLARMPLRILVTGCEGQLGYELTRRLAETGLALFRDRQSLDVSRPEAAEAIAFARPECIIHCAAFTRVQDAEKHRDECWKTNVFGSALVAEAAARLDAMLVHISSDHVFGLHPTSQPWKTTDAPGPLTYYGWTKLAAEHAVLNTAHRHPDWPWWIIRTSALFERPLRWRRNFPQLLLAQRHRRDGIPVITDAWTVPTYVPHFVDGLLTMLQRKSELPSGIYHLVAGGQASWFEFASEVARGFADLRITPVSRAAYARMNQIHPDSIPSWSVLDGSELARWLGPRRLPDWRAGVQAWIKDWYEEELSPSSRRS